MDIAKVQVEDTADFALKLFATVDKLRKDRKAGETDFCREEGETEPDKEGGRERGGIFCNGEAEGRRYRTQEVENAAAVAAAVAAEVASISTVWQLTIAPML